jgi:hypothetical protein
MEAELQETWINLSPSVLPAAGAILVVTGLSLILWSDILVNVIVVTLGILAILLGIGFLAGGHFLGRIGVLPLFLFLAGFLSIVIGILAFLRRDLVFDLIIYLGAGLAILAGLLLLFIGGLLSVHGTGRRVFLAGGTAFLLLGVFLALFPALISRIIIGAGGVAIAGAGGAVLFMALARNRRTTGHP